MCVGSDVNMNISFINFCGSKFPETKRTDFTRLLKENNKINNKGLDKDTFEYSSAPIHKSHKTESEKVKERYNDVVKSLELIKDNARDSFEAQCKKNGFISKSYDGIKALWFSNNREKLVKKDIDTYNEQLDELSKSVEKGKFTKTFKKIFGLPYNQENIDKFNKANERLMLASTTKYMADTIEKTIGEDLKIATENKGELKGYTDNKFLPYAPTGSIPVASTYFDRNQVFSKMEASLSKAVGGNDVLKGMLQNQKIKEDASKEEKYKAYCNIANFLSKTSKNTAEKWSNGKSIKELTKDYNDAYEKAFGWENNIQKRVDRYNRSQQIGLSMLKAGIKNPMKLAIVAITGITNPLAVIPASVAIDFGMDMLEKSTNNDKKDEELSAKTMKQLAKDTAIDYADYLIDAGFSAVVPNLETGNVILNGMLSGARKTTIDVTTSMITEYMDTGKWDKTQIAPRAFVAAVFGKISPDDELAKDLLAMTQNGVKKSLLYDDSEKNSVKQFINKLQTELQQEYMKNPEMYSAMKTVSMNDPKVFEDMIVDILQEQIDEKSKSQTGK